MAGEPEEPKEHSKVEPLFLIAIPQLGDPNFARSVVLLLHHGADGALGLVINAPTEMTLGAFAKEHSLPCHSANKERPILRGGPVEPSRGWILHGDESVEERQDVLPGLCVSGSIGTLNGLLADGAKPFRLMLGYAGWGAGQLESEMEHGSWITVEASAKHVLETPPATCWDAVLREMGVDPTRLAIGSGIH